jgi:hypothetical protein
MIFMRILTLHLMCKAKISKHIIWLWQMIKCII